MHRGRIRETDNSLLRVHIPYRGKLKAVMELAKPLKELFDVVDEAEAGERRGKGSAPEEEDKEEEEIADFNLRAAKAPREAMIKDDIC